MTTIEDYFSLSVTGCKKLGFFRQGAKCKGVISWTYRGGKKAAEILFLTDTREEIPFARVCYNCNGREYNYTIALRWKPSNLNPEQGYYYFVCPVTGLSCRKLYLINGRFVSRRAYSVLYKSQVQSRTYNGGLFKAIDDIEGAAELRGQRYRKPYYRGRLTPYGRKLLKAEIAAAHGLAAIGVNASGT